MPESVGILSVAPEIDAPHILFVDDDLRIRQLLQAFLRDNGMHCTTAESAAEAKDLLGLFAFDLVISDIMMPGQDGISLTSEICETLQTPVMIISALGTSSQNRNRGLAAGADDYVTKPYDPDEIVYRIRNILKRIPEEKSGPLRLGPLAYSTERRELTRNGENIPLTDTENRVLYRLAINANHPLSRRELGEGEDNQPDTHSDRSVDIAVSRLRRKLEASPRNPRYLKTVRNKGYILLPEPLP